MKTILHVIDTTGPGGAETIFIDLATRLPREKYRPVVVIRGKGWVYEELCRRGINPILLQAKGSFNWRYLWELVKLVRRENIDIIQSHLLGANVYCAIAGILTRTPVIATFHGEVDIGEKERLKALKMYAINTGVSKVIAVSAGLCADIVRRTNLIPGKIDVIYNGIETSAFQVPRTEALKKRFSWGDDVFVIGCLGNIRRAKAYDLLLQVAAQLIVSDESYRFVIAGQPDHAGLYESLLDKRRELGLEAYVQFLGFLDKPAEFLSNLDLFLSTSVSEGLPLAAIQAMATGLPLIATRCGGYEELVTDQKNGCLVEVGNVNAIAAAIQGLKAKPWVRSEIGKEARQHVQQTFDTGVMFEQYQSIYDEILL